MEETTQKPQGKGLAVTGFVISLVAIVFFWIISPIALATAAFGGNGYILSAIWLVLSLAGAALCFMGMKKLGATGGSKGLAMTGLILCLVAVALCAWLIYGVSQAQSAVGDAMNQLGPEFQNAMDQIGDSIQ
jgi:hypothetical protein